MKQLISLVVCKQILFRTFFVASGEFILNTCKGRVMIISYVFNFFLFWLMFINVFSQNLQKNNKNIVFEYSSQIPYFTYRLLGKYWGENLAFNEYVENKQIYIASLEKKYKLDPAFGSNMWLVFVPKHDVLYRREVKIAGRDTIFDCDINSKNYKNELSVYAISGHSTRGDMFIMKPNKDSVAYFWEKYEAYPFLGNYWFQLNRIDSTTYGSTYKIYYYCVSCARKECFEEKEYGEDYLEIGYCPKFGSIYSYYYIYSDIRILLKSINGVSIEDFVKQNRCIRPFCDME